MSKTLLLADDSVTIQKVVGITFANEDVELITVDNGDDALARARELRPDAILADVSMPGLDGYALCAEIKRDPSLAHIPVLLLTGTFEPFDAARAGEVHPDGHIAKPFEAQVLIDQVLQLLAAGATAAEPLPDLAPTPVETQPEALNPSTSDAPLTPPLPSAIAPPVAASPESGDYEAPGATRIFGAPGADPLLPSDPLDPIPEEEFELQDPPDLMFDAEPIEADAPGPKGWEPAVAAHDSQVEADPPSAFFGEESFAGGADSTATPLLGVDEPDVDDPSVAASFETLPADGIQPEVPEDYDETPITPFLNLERERVALDELPELDALPDDDLPWLEPEPEPEPEPDGESSAWAKEIADERPIEAAEWTSPAAGSLAPADVEALRQVLEKMAWEAFGPLTERLVTDVVRKVEEVAWQVIPELAERLIRAEIERLKSQD